jgi:uncharacterized repeat protein (TIGR03837 family)
MRARRYDIFVKVVDNFGDAGVCWRLARQLVREHAASVTLWIDAPASLARIAPGFDASRDEQTVDGVRVRALFGAPEPLELPDVVIEGFGCGLPDHYVEGMVESARPPVWINLEYLSAEPWVDGTHGLPSPQPRLPLTRHFFFPGFTEATGGLLREAGLLEARDAAQADAAAGLATWRAFGIAPPAPGALTLSLFCYPNRTLAALFDRWTDGAEPIACFVPEGVGVAALETWAGEALARAGQSLRRGSLSVTVLPFVAQEIYDRLLWTCDANFVRGEDSFVRAQWAARPFVWHIYPQAEGAHRVKLDAFLHRFRAGLDPAAAQATGRFWTAWNDDDAAGAAAAWTPFRGEFPTLAEHGRRWAQRLAALPDLASALADFADDRL